jgi:hypothetical protein
VIARVPFDEGGLIGRIRPDSEFPDGDFRGSYFRGDRRRQVAERVEAIVQRLAEAIERADLPVMGSTDAGEPVVVANEVRAGLRRPDPYDDMI